MAHGERSKRFPPMNQPAAARGRARIVVITGPTACGKSGLALAAAEAFDGVVINADSMQVYRELQVLTARPDAAAAARVPHRLYGVLPAGEACSAERWRAWAAAEIDAGLAAGRVPILVGGTGLYLRALLRGLVPVPDVPAAVRASVRRRQKELSAQALHAELAARDPAMAARLRPGDGQRIARALEVVEATGRSIADYQGRGCAQDGPAYDALVVAALPPRERLYETIDRRFEAMVTAGALEEVRELMDLGLDPDLPALKAVGVPELMAHLRGETSLQRAVGDGQRATRRYAKRQLTWLRHQTPRDASRGVFLYTQFSESVIPIVFNEIRVFLLTAQP